MDSIVQKNSKKVKMSNLDIGPIFKFLQIKRLIA